MLFLGFFTVLVLCAMLSSVRKEYPIWCFVRLVIEDLKEANFYSCIKEDETSKREEEVEIDSRNSKEDGEAENLLATIDEKAGVETSDGECDDEEEEKPEESRSDKKVDLRKMTLGEWFKFMEVHVQKQIVEETEKMFELMRSKALRVDQLYCRALEKKQAKGKRSVS
ncbi:hypothetical protein HA466_0289880 [Hirschfeldia incana]|nr:hypothetical protein HA466_0289880 [Hirschfeldia incana]